jgi:NADPH:quinone reductase-like Zn-dependent oxidoreductase
MAGCVLLQDKVRGKRIMGMTPQNSIATMVAVKPHALWDVPDSWTLAQAATVPVAYATAYDALVVRGRLQPHHRVLIHSASGAVGLAATRICINRGCEVSILPVATCMHYAKQERSPAAKGLLTILFGFYGVCLY